MKIRSFLRCSSLADFLMIKDTIKFFMPKREILINLLTQFNSDTYHRTVLAARYSISFEWVSPKLAAQYTIRKVSQCGKIRNTAYLCLKILGSFKNHINFLPRIWMLLKLGNNTLRLLLLKRHEWKDSKVDGWYIWNGRSIVPLLHGLDKGSSQLYLIIEYLNYPKNSIKIPFQWKVSFKLSRYRN